ncbi:hypothetical protein BC834DRAFT_892812 [Gloeopeniophorella convolvens]|nr:hypothetical protein BC834DRAFT_892812 [Gloeopeniophorella convolvens]
MTSSDNAISLDRLYPTISSPVQDIHGVRNSDDENAQVLLRTLRHNHQHHHAFIGNRWFHNHAAHHVLAIYALGASPQRIEEAYRAQSSLTPTISSPESITDANFVEHLGKERRYYGAYVAYFSRHLMNHTPLETLQHFLFLPTGNYRPYCSEAGGNCKQPAMLGRLMSKLLHPFIHVAYGIEFALPGQVAEGLAQAAVQKNDQAIFLPPRAFTEPGNPTGSALAFMERTNTLSLTSPPEYKPHARPTFAYHQRILEDAIFAVQPPKRYVQQYPAIMKAVGPAIKALVCEWEAGWLKDARSSADIEARLTDMVEEVAWGNALWFGVGGWTSRGDTGRGINADLYVMHLVTSSIFLLTLVMPGSSSQQLSLEQRLLLLRTYLAVSTATYISRGCAKSPLSINAFYAATQIYLQRPLSSASNPTPDKREDPWLPIISTAVAHPDEHLPKTVRALAAFAARWGTRPAGYFTGGLLHSETLDGTLFLRIAGLVVDRFVQEIQGETNGWDNVSGDFP